MGEGGVEVVEGEREGAAGDGAGPFVVHAYETDFRAEADAFPDAVFGGDEVGEAFADEGEAGEGGGVDDGGLEEDFDEDFGGDTGEGTWWWWRGLC